MKNFISIIILSFMLSGCAISTDSKEDINKALDDLFDAGFTTGVECMVRVNNAEKCMEILKIAREKLNDSKN